MTHSPLPINFYKIVLYFPYPFNVTDWIIQHCGGDIPLPNHNGQEATDAFIAFHPGTAWKHLDNLFTVSRDYRKLCIDFAKAGLFKKKGHGVMYLFCFTGFLLFLSYAFWSIVGVNLDADFLLGS
ncbi:hypothetical protein H5410_064724 [Solanum commersonii]|uniref:Cytochrome b5 heme-binding domain-containing protein n=1 Tax=Solanum commersonii TaxID=4109 RepID=A0A9J5VYM0_SOLCO|nr:hypothetical protein H5410_064724 [Solanum commersonii]